MPRTSSELLTPTSLRYLFIRLLNGFRGFRFFYHPIKMISRMYLLVDDTAHDFQNPLMIRSIYRSAIYSINCIYQNHLQLQECNYCLNKQGLNFNVSFWDFWPPIIQSQLGEQVAKEEAFLRQLIVQRDNALADYRQHQTGLKDIIQLFQTLSSEQERKIKLSES